MTLLYRGVDGYHICTYIFYYFFIAIRNTINSFPPSSLILYRTTACDFILSLCLSQSPFSLSPPTFLTFLQNKSLQIHLNALITLLNFFFPNSTNSAPFRTSQQNPSLSNASLNDSTVKPGIVFASVPSGAAEAQKCEENPNY